MPFAPCWESRSPSCSRPWSSICLSEVVLRYVFAASLSWYDEVVGYLLVWLTFLGAVLAQSHEQHIGIGDLVDRAPARARRALAIARHLVLVGVHAGTPPLWMAARDPLSRRASDHRSGSDGCRLRRHSPFRGPHAAGGGRAHRAPRCRSLRSWKLSFSFFSSPWCFSGSPSATC